MALIVKAIDNHIFSDFNAFEIMPCDIWNWDMRHPWMIMAVLASLFPALGKLTLSFLNVTFFYWFQLVIFKKKAAFFIIHSFCICISFCLHRKTLILKKIANPSFAASNSLN